MDAYLGSLPGHGVENVRRPLINTMNLADLLPVNTIWTGKPISTLSDVSAQFTAIDALCDTRSNAFPAESACA
jgi:hypothetical protein